MHTPMITAISNPVQLCTVHNIHLYTFENRFTTNDFELEKMAISAAFTLEAALPPVVLSFNLEAHNAPDYQISAFIGQSSA